MNNFSLTKEQVAQAVITGLKENNGKVTIETGLFKEYNNPSKVILKLSNSGYTPDIKTIASSGETKIYEIELSSNYNEEKWYLFSLYTKKIDGVLVLVIPKNRLEKVKSIIKENKLENVQLLYI